MNDVKIGRVQGQIEIRSRMMGVWSRPLALIVACCIAPGVAHAQAFTQPAGQGRVITSVIHTKSDKIFDDNGAATDVPDISKTEIYLQGEYGVTDDLTVLLTPSFRFISVEGGADSANLGYTDIGARYRVLNDDNVVLSLQGKVRIPGQTQRNSLAQIGQTDAEYDFRGQLAYTFGQGSFVSVESGYRVRAGEPPNEFHVDATVGIRASEKFLITANSFNVISDGRGSGIFSSPHRYHNLFLGGAYDVSSHVTLQLGVTGTIDGRNALRERGAFASVWTRF
ncbi:hypothetical protein WG901_08690 [Novosphingobium sp. PS1R-30]|uniref:MetA-pathway of phenol degradation n=1 Tax=Novosphingobium anseongense TaxID=3133436 RepID=A0ABU8RUC6_9SPHN